MTENAPRTPQTSQDRVMPISPGRRPMDPTETVQDRKAKRKRRPGWQSRTVKGYMHPELASESRLLLERGRAQFAKAVGEDEEFIGKLVQDMKLRALDGDDVALRLVAKVLETAQDASQAVSALLKSHGLQSEEELRRIVVEAKSAEGLTEHEAFQRVLGWGADYLNKNPDRREAAVRRWGGEIPKDDRRV